MLEKITNTFSDVVKKISGKSSITEKNIEEAVEQTQTHREDHEAHKEQEAGQHEQITRDVFTTLVRLGQGHPAFGSLSHKKRSLHEHSAPSPPRNETPCLMVYLLIAVREYYFTLTLLE